ncbi:unnamed protein product, partial [Rotaria sp. Silwood1]
HVGASASSTNVMIDDRIEGTQNKFHRYARLGTTGKYYCGGELDGSQCQCCNDRCGPSNGCNLFRMKPLLTETNCNRFILCINLTSFIRR